MEKIENKISYDIRGCAFKIHNSLGPGLLESVYEACFVEELKTQGLFVEPQIWVPVNYKGKMLGGKLKLDLLVERLVVVENKAVEVMIPLYEAQVLSYLKLSNKPKGLLINFNTVNLSSHVVSLGTEEFARLPEY